MAGCNNCSHRTAADDDDDDNNDGDVDDDDNDDVIVLVHHRQDVESLHRGVFTKYIQQDASAIVGRLKYSTVSTEVRYCNCRRHRQAVPMVLTGQRRQSGVAAQQTTNEGKQEFRTSHSVFKSNAACIIKWYRPQLTFLLGRDAAQLCSRSNLTVALFYMHGFEVKA